MLGPVARATEETALLVVKFPRFPKATPVRVIRWAYPRETLRFLAKAVRLLEIVITRLVVGLHEPVGGARIVGTAIPSDGVEAKVVLEITEEGQILQKQHVFFSCPC